MENFIKDTLNQLIEDAVELKNNADNDFEKGSLFGYYTCISKIFNQAEAFGIFDKLPNNLRQFNPEYLLSEIHIKPIKIQMDKGQDLVQTEQNLLHFWSHNVYMEGIEILITSPPDRERLVAEIWYEDYLIAEINQERETLELEIFVSKTGGLKLGFDDFVDTLKKAKEKLTG